MSKNIVAVVFMFFVINADANEVKANANLFLGKKSLDSDDWGLVDDISVYGFLSDVKPSNWPVSIAIDVMLSKLDETVFGTTNFYEGYGGIRKIWEINGSSVRPYIGGGLALIGAEVAGVGGPAIDTGTGSWLSGGVYLALGSRFNLGLDVRYSKAEVTLYGVDVDVGGTYAGLILGHQFR